MSSPRLVGHAAVFSITLVASGCATGGSAWLHEPEEPHDATRDARAEWTSDRRNPVHEDVNEFTTPAFAARPRLHEVVTIGTSDFATTRAEETSVTAAPAPVTVQVNNTFAPVVTTTSSSFAGGWSSGRGVAPARASVPARTDTTAPRVQPGQDWPAPRDSGPRFPFTAAGDPWRRDR